MNHECDIVEFLSASSGILKDFFLDEVPDKMKINEGE